MARTVSPSDPDTEIARRHFARGTAFYNNEKYADAIGAFEKARKVKPLPAFDYNIARCLDRMERVAEAITEYERYLAAISLTDPDTTEVRARIAVLRQRLGEAERAKALPPPREDAPTAVSATTAAPAVTEPPPTRLRRRIYTWIAGGAGAALLVGSIAAGLVAHSRHDDLQSNCTPDGACDAATIPDAQSWIGSGKAAALTSDVLLGVGAAAVAAGAVLYFVEGRRPTGRRAQLFAHTLSTTSAGLVVGGAW